MTDIKLKPSLYLIRHGALESNPERRFVGSTDVSLSEQGRQQMNQLAKELRDLLLNSDLAAILSSDLQRSRESARILYEQALSFGRTDLALHHDNAFNEINLGKWEGLTPQEVQATYPGQYESRWNDFATFCPPDGENFIQVQQRSLRALTHWQNIFSGKTFILVAHAGVNRCILANYLALPLTAFVNLGQLLKLPQNYASFCWLI